MSDLLTLQVFSGGESTLGRFTKSTGPAKWEDIVSKIANYDNLHA